MSIMQDNDDYGDLMKAEDWITAVECGALTSYDGVGKLSDGTQQLTGFNLCPSHLIHSPIRELINTFGFVMWYNK